MTTLQLSIDARPARQGARDFARFAEDIRRAAASAQNAVESLEGAAKRLAEAQFSAASSARDGIGKLVPVALSRGPSGFASSSRGDLLSLARSSQQEFSGALGKLIERERTRLQSVIDDVADAIESVGGLLDSLPEGVGDSLKKLNQLDLPLRIADAVLEALKPPTIPNDAFQLFNDLNASIPGLRGLSDQATGKAKEVVDLVLSGFEASAGSTLELLLEQFSRATTAVINQDNGGFREGASLPALRNLRELTDILLSISRTAVEPGDREKIRQRLEIQELDSAENLFAPTGRRKVAGRLSGSIGLDNNLLIRAGLPLSGGAFASNSSVPALGPTAFADALPPEMMAAIEANRTIAEGLELNIQASRDFADGAEAAFRSYAASATDAAGQAQDLVTNGLKGMEDALVGFVQTGKIEFRSLIDSLVADLLRLVIRTQVLGPLAQALGGAFGASGAFAGGTGPAPGSFRAAQTIGMAHGGSFVVPGSGGVDSVVPIFRATPGERVTVTPPGRGAGGSVVNVNVINEAGAQVGVQETANGQGGVDIEVLIARAVERDIADGGRVARAIAQNFGARPAAVGR